LPVPTGTYNQARLFFVDTDATLASSAQSAGATFNNEVDYFDSANVQQKARLAVPNADNGVAGPIKLDVLTSQKAILAALGSTSSTTNNSTTNNTTNNSVCDTTSISYNAALCNQQTASQSSTTNNSSTTDTGVGANGFGTTTASAAVVFDAGRDIT